MVVTIYLSVSVLNLLLRDRISLKYGVTLCALAEEVGGKDMYR